MFLICYWRDSQVTIIMPCLTSSEKVKRALKEGQDIIRNACFTSASKIEAEEVKVGVTYVIKPGLGKIQQAI